MLHFYPSRSHRPTVSGQDVRDRRLRILPAGPRFGLETVREPRARASRKIYRSIEHDTVPVLLGAQPAEELYGAGRGHVSTCVRWNGRESCGTAVARHEGRNDPNRYDQPDCSPRCGVFPASSKRGDVRLASGSGQGAGPRWLPEYRRHPHVGVLREAGWQTFRLRHAEVFRTPASPPPLVAGTWPTLELGTGYRPRIWRNAVRDAGVSGARLGTTRCGSRAPKPRERVTPASASRLGERDSPILASHPMRRSAAPKGARGQTLGNEALDEMAGLSTRADTVTRNGSSGRAIFSGKRRLGPDRDSG